MKGRRTNSSQSKINYSVGHDNYDTHKSLKKPLAVRSAKIRKVGYYRISKRVLTLAQKVWKNSNSFLVEFGQYVPTKPGKLLRNSFHASN